MIFRLLNVVVGVWLMAAPAVLGYSDMGPASVERIVGPLVISAAIIAIWPEVRPVRWVNVVLGAMLALAPLVLRAWITYPGAASVNEVACGLLILAAAAVRGRIDARFGGGWRSVWRSGVDTTGS